MNKFTISLSTAALITLFFSNASFSMEEDDSPQGGRNLSKNAPDPNEALLAQLTIQTELARLHGYTDMAAQGDATIKKLTEAIAGKKQAGGYGGETGKSHFQKKSPEIVKELTAELVKYRQLCTLLKSNGMEDRITPPLAILNKAAEFRRQLAMDTRSKDAFKYSVPRENESISCDLTPLHRAEYDSLRKSISRKIALMGKDNSGVWIESGKSRYRLTVLTASQCPTSISMDSLRQFQKASQDLVTEKGRKTLVSTKQDVDLAAQFDHFKDFISRAAFVTESTGFESIQQSVVESLAVSWEKTLTKEEKRTEGVSFLLPFVTQKTKKELKKYKAMPLDEGYELGKGIKPRGRPEKSPKFFRLETEHKVPTTPGELSYIPGYSLLGVLEWDSIESEKLPAAICHPVGMYVPFLAHDYKEALKNSALTDSTKKDDLISEIGQYCFHWIKTMPYSRGSAAVMEWISEALYNSHGYDLMVKEDTLSIDHQGYLNWTLEEFLESYKPRIQLTSKK